MLSGQVALWSLLVSGPLAVAAAGWMSQRRWADHPLLDSLILLPVGLPPVVVGLLMWSAFSAHSAGGELLHEWTGWTLRLIPDGAVLVASVMVTPMMIRMLRPAFEAQCPELLAAVRTLGASPWQAWWSAWWRPRWPAVASAWALGFAAAWGESGATIMLATLLPDATHAATVPLTLWRESPSNAWPLATCAVAVAMVAVGVSEWARRQWRTQATRAPRP